MTFIDNILHRLQGSQETKEMMRERIFDALPLPLLVCNKGFSILRANPAFTRHFKVGEDHLLGKTALQILGTDIKVIDKKYWWPVKERQVSKPGDLVQGANPKILKGNFPQIGQRVFHLYTRTALPFILLIFEDVSKSKDIEEKIIRSRRELLSLFDGIEDPMVMIDENYRIRRINDAMLRTVGGDSHQKFIGKACYYKLHGLTEKCPGCTAGKTFQRGKKTVRIGLLQKQKDAENFVYQIICHPLKDSPSHSSGKVPMIVESYRDMTEVKKVEEELYESERARIMEPLAAGIAHEVRNPLAIIRSTAQYCLGEVGPDKDLHESLQTIIKSVETANHVVTDLLDFARSQKVDFCMRPLKPVLEKGLLFVKARIKAQKIRVAKRIQKIPPLLLDEKRFLQAFMNLLVNSLDAMPHGGQLEIEASANHHGKGEMCTVVIRDSGGGVPEEMISKLFKPFYSTKKNGVGLGLPIAEGIIRSHGGKIRFLSWRGKGTEVRIILPTKTLLRT